MSQRLIPRLQTEAATKRFAEVQTALANGTDPADLVDCDPADAIPNPVGGQPATPTEIRRWREEVRAAVTPISGRNKVENDRHGLELGRALCRVVDPVRGDAGHDGTWSFLSLYVFPDIVNERWPMTARKDGGTQLSVDRWVGSQAAGAYDRNYIKTAWFRYSILGDVMENAKNPLGEDEFGGLLERTAVARNTRLITHAAQTVVAYDGPRGRMEFTRDFMKLLGYQTGPRSLDLLSDDELQQLVETTAAQAWGSAEPLSPRRAAGLPSEQGSVSTSAEFDARVRVTGLVRSFIRGSRGF